MNNFLEELKATKVIDKNDIKKIQNFINIKYKDEDSKKRAYILSSTIHNIIEDKMEFLPKQTQKDLKNTIFKNTFLNNKDSIYLWDVFYSYIHYVDFKEENIEILLNWLNINMKSKTNKEDLIDYLYKNNLLKIFKKNIEIKDSCISTTKYIHINIEDEISSDFKDANTNVESEHSSDFKNNKTNIEGENPSDFKDTNINIEGEHLSDFKNNNIKITYEGCSTFKNSCTEIKCEHPVHCQNCDIKIKNNSINNFNSQIEECKDERSTKKLNISFFYKQNIFIHNLYNSSIYFSLIILGISFICVYSPTVNTSIKTNNKNIAIYENKNISTKKINTLDKNPNVPEYIKYKPLETQKIKKYLYTKNSVLAEEPYFSSIIKSAEEFDINPLLLFAITGQEQGFVPKKQKYSKEIANNPFNVFHSWKEYNTNIEDSSRIAGRTVFNLLKDIPKEQDPFKWINSKYAEDENWWKGVKSIFEELEKSLK